MRPISIHGLSLFVSLFGAAACGGGDKSNIYPNDYLGAGGTGYGDPTAPSNWSTTPNTTASLYGIWGSGSSDVWAVGSENNIQHWNGSAWSTSLSGTTGELRAAWGSSPNNVWAAGSSMLHWDGAAWTANDSVTLSGNYGDYISGIWGSSADDVWAVGGGEDGDSCYAWHWDGSTWTRTDIATSLYAGLNSIWGSGPSDVWAVGGGTLGDGVIVHWDGHAWSKVLEGSSTTPLFGMFGVWGSGPSDVWAVGMQNIAHYDGTSWKLEQCSVLASQYTAGSTALPCPRGLRGVWGSAGNDVWAVGNMAYGGYGFIEHYNGTSWTMNEIGMLNGANDIWGSGANDVWVVGPLVLQGGVILHKKP